MPLVKFFDCGFELSSLNKGYEYRKKINKKKVFVKTCPYSCDNYLFGELTCRGHIDQEHYDMLKDIYF